MPADAGPEGENRNLISRRAEDMECGSAYVMGELVLSFRTERREREMETDRLPTFVEVVSRRTRPPVDLFMF